MPYDLCVGTESLASLRLIYPKNVLLITGDIQPMYLTHSVMIIAWIKKYKDVFWPAIELILPLQVSSGVDFYPELLKLYYIRH